MVRFIASVCLVFLANFSRAQNVMTPELLWQLKRVSGVAVTKESKQVIYRVTTYDLAENKSSSKVFGVPIAGGASAEMGRLDIVLDDKTISPDGKNKVVIREVKLAKVEGKEIYPDLDKANVQVYNSLNYRHWDTWEDGSYSHLFVQPVSGGPAKDVMPNEMFDSPQKPFGGDEDFTWSPDSKRLIYVCKKKSGLSYATSTNTDLFEYNLASAITVNLTEGIMGYDTEPAFSQTGSLAWLSMKRSGYESDKNDILVRNGSTTINLTEKWDGTVSHFRWSNDGKLIYFIAPIGGTIQLFSIESVPSAKSKVKQITSGDYDVSSMVGQSGNTMIVTRTDMNHAAEIYSVNLGNGQMTQLTRVNDAVYSKLGLSKVEKRMVPTTDGKQMVVWVIYPPDFDASKKYPALLYCQGGPQSALSQYYSYRWNFQLMAANGYVIVAPNRRGMPGHGVAWNEQISKDHGGQVMQDYLSAIDNVSAEPFIDKSRLGCVGASYGGYSAFFLAGIHNNRFKTFISHDGIFNLKSMYGTTEELWFVNWDFGGPYWEKDNAAAQKSYTQFDPSNMVDKWTAPILIFQGGKDYRVPDGQGFEAFQAAQVRGIKSRLIYLPTENHWVLTAQNSIVWQREFFKWLKETL